MSVDSVASSQGRSRGMLSAVADARVEERVALVLLALLPGGLMVYLGFEAGGYFPGSVAFVALLLTSIVLLRVLVAAEPCAGFSRAHAITAGLFAALAAWTLASSLWSNASDQALIEFDRVWLYLLLLVLFGMLGRRRWLVRWMTRGIAGGALVVCTAALITRLLPHVWPVAPGLAPSRLSYPLTYWNALGILAAFGVILGIGISADPVEHRISRALAAAAVPIAAVTLLLTFSRGSIITLIIGLLVLMIICRSSALPGALLATAPVTAIALLVAYHAKLLATANPTGPAAVAQGRRVAVVVAVAVLTAGVIRWALGPLDRRLAVTRPPWSRLSRKTASGTAVGALAVITLVAVIAGAPGLVSREYQQFLKSAPVPTTNVTARLTNASSGGRVALWHIALHAFSTAPLNGTGAGTYELDLNKYRDPSVLPVADAHNLYLQTLAELGVIGLALLVAVLATVLVALARRVRGPDRVLYAALFSTSVVWALHCAVDWDWQMPAVTAWLFALAGVTLAAEPPTPRVVFTDRRVRVQLAAGLLLAAVTPLLIMQSQAHLQRAANALVAGDCAAAQSEATASLSALSDRAIPYMILGYCDIHDGLPQDAVVAMRIASQQEPGNWQYRYGLAIADAYASVNPRPALLAAIRLDPNDQLLFDPLKPVLHTDSQTRWLAAAQAAYGAVLVSGRLTLR